MMNEQSSGLGLDLCAIPRMEEQLNNTRFLERLFTEEERAYIQSKGRGAAQTMAGLFAAKEAFAKALGTGIAFPLKDIAVKHTESGQPFYAPSGKALELLNGRRAMLSVTHEGDMAAAVCILLL